MPIEPRDLRPGDDSRKNWRTINALTARLERLEAAFSRLFSSFTGERLKPDWGKGGSGGGIQYKGEWTDTLIVGRDDLVKVSFGPQAGSYLCVLTPPVGWNPWAGTYYVAIGRPTDQFWL